jgi:hypothetical protein
MLIFSTFLPVTISTVDSPYSEAVKTLSISHVAMFVGSYIERHDQPRGRVVKVSDY